MKKTLLCSLMLATTLAGNVQAQSIFDALGQAYNTNPTLQSQRAYLRAVDENVAIAKSGYRPNVSLNGKYTDSDTDVKNSEFEPDGDSYSYSARISQPLFSGLQTVNAVKSADSMVKAEQNNLYNVEQSVLLDASTAYLDVVQNKAIVDLQKNNEKLLKKRLDETLQRFNVGEVTRTDVSQARARYARAKADRISSEGTLEASKAVYARVIGVAPTEVKTPDGLLDKFLPKTFEEALEYAKVHSYSILQAQNNFDSKEYDVKANTGALLPQVSLDGSAVRSRNYIDGLMVLENVMM